MPPTAAKDLKHTTTVNVSVGAEVFSKAFGEVTESVESSLVGVMTALEKVTKNIPDIERLAIALERVSKNGLGIPAGGDGTPAGLGGGKKTTSYRDSRGGELPPEAMAVIAELTKALRSGDGSPGARRALNAFENANYVTYDKANSVYNWAEPSGNKGIFNPSDTTAINRASMRYTFGQYAVGKDRILAAMDRNGFGELSQGQLNLSQNAPKIAQGMAGALGLEVSSLAPLIAGVGSAVAVGAIAWGAYEVGKGLWQKYDAERRVGLESGKTGVQAAAEGTYQDIQIRMMAMSPFFNDEQAREMVKGVYGHGYKGKKAETILEFAKENYKEFNLGVAESVEAYREVVERGGVSMKSFNSTMKDLQVVTRGSDMTLKQVMKTWADASKVMGALGAVGEGKFARGQEMTDATRSMTDLSPTTRGSFWKGLGTASAPGPLMTFMQQYGPTRGQTPTQIAKRKNFATESLNALRELVLTMIPELRQLHGYSYEEIEEFFASPENLAIGLATQVVMTLESNGIADFGGEEEQMYRWLAHVLGGTGLKNIEEGKKKKTKARAEESKPRATNQAQRFAAGAHRFVKDGGPAGLGAGIPFLSKLLGGAVGSGMSIMSQLRGDGAATSGSIFNKYSKSWDFWGSAMDNWGAWSKSIDAGTVSDSRRKDIYDEALKAGQEKVFIEVGFKGAFGDFLTAVVNRGNNRKRVGRGHAGTNED